MKLQLVYRLRLKKEARQCGAVNMMSLVDDLIEAQITVTAKIKTLTEYLQPMELNSNGNYVIKFLNQDSTIRPAKKSKIKQKDSGE